VCQVRGHRCAQASVRSVMSTALPGKSVAAGIHEEGKRKPLEITKEDKVCVFITAVPITNRSTHTLQGRFAHLSLPPQPSAHSFFFPGHEQMGRRCKYDVNMHQHTLSFSSPQVVI
jgi:hypothetical protein